MARVPLRHRSNRNYGYEHRSLSDSDSPIENALALVHQLPRDGLDRG